MYNTEIVDIYLIHGTFAMNSTWINKNSKLRVHLSDTVNSDLRFNVFIWNGKNSFRQREIAAQRLTQKILTSSNKEYAKVLIGHSHGGNIALYSSKSLNENDLIITLGTPFIHDKNDNNLFALHNWTKLILLIALYGQLLLYEEIYASWETWFTIYWISLGILVWYLLYKYLKKEILKTVQAFKSKIKYPEKTSVKVLNIQYEFDEASYYLNALNKKLRPISNIVHKILYNLKNWHIGIFMLFLILIIIDDKYQLPPIIGSISTLIILPIYLAMVLLPLSMLLNGFLTNSFTFGSNNFSGSFFSKINISKNLPVEFNNKEEKFIESNKKGIAKFNHSQYYSDNYILNEISVAINEHLKNTADNIR